jgi:hypothetical protein
MTRKGRKRSIREPLPISGVVGAWLRGQKADRRVQLCRIQDAWPELVGDEVARRTRPRAISGGVLTVAVASSAWLNELTFLRARLTTKINEMENVSITEIRLVHGDCDPQATSSRRRRRGLSDRPTPQPGVAVNLPQAYLDEVEQEIAPVGDLELREAIRRARVSYLRRRHSGSAAPRRRG